MNKIMKKVILAVLAALIAVAAMGQELQKSVTWEKIRNHPAPLPVIGELVNVPSSRAGCVDAPMI